MSYFGIGIYQPKFKENIGTLWRSAYLLGASFIFVIDGSFKKYPTDTYHSWKQIPFYNYDTYEDMSIPQDCSVVGVETSDLFPKAIDLDNFTHPKKCIYILGNESRGLPLSILEKCNAIVSISAVRQQSYNVAMAGTILMYNRMQN